MKKIAHVLQQNDHVRGNKKAAVVFVEYGDYECPYCGEAYHVIKEVLKELGTEITFVFRNFPLKEVHPHALAAASAAEAAGLQGFFWEMHDLLFENQDQLEDTDLVSYAQQLDLDTEKFTKDMDSQEVHERIQKDFMSGIRAGANGTPTFFVNGKRYDGAYDFESLMQLLEPHITSSHKVHEKKYAIKRRHKSP